MRGIPLFLLVAAVAACPGLSYAAERETEDEIVKVTGIEIVRESRPVAVTDRQILSLMEIKPGSAYPLQKYLMIADSDVKRLFAKGILVNSWEPARPKGEFVLRITVEERILIGKLTFAGADKIEEEDVAKEGEKFLAVNKASDQALIRFACGKIRSYYRSRGFRFAEVTAQIYQMSGGRSHVEVRIFEGPRPRIVEIRFRGNTSIESDELMDQMDTEESDFFSNKYLEDSKLADDIKAVAQHYRERGFRNAHAFLEDIVYNATFDEMIVVLRVQEGARFRIGKVAAKGFKFFTKEKIWSQIQVKPGSWYSRMMVEGERKKDEKGDVRRIIDLYGAEGFLFVRITPVESFDLEKNTVDITYNIEEGERIKLGRVVFRGNHKTRDDVLRRFIFLTPGEHPSLSGLEDTLMCLSNTKYFKDIHPGWEDTEDPAVKDLVLDLEESTMGDIKFILGYSPSTSLTGKVQLQFSNFDLSDLPESLDDLLSGNAFVGGGQNLRIGFTIGMERQSVYFMDFYEPSFFGTDLSIKVGGNKNQREYGSYLQRSTEGNMEFGYRLSRFLSASAGYNLKYVELRSISPYAAPDVFDSRGPSFISSIQLGLSLSRLREDVNQPYEGLLTSLIYEYAGGFLQGDVNYTKVGFRFSLFTTLWTKPLFFFDSLDKYRQILSFHFKVDWAEGHGGQPSLPIYERFFAGGLGSIRGFEYRGIGPRWNYDAIGGNFMTTASLEYSIPLIRSPLVEASSIRIDLLRFVLFYDVAALVRDVEDFSTSQIRSSVGFGFRLRVPAMGGIPISLDFGFPLARLKDDETERVSFSIGIFFF